MLAWNYVLGNFSTASVFHQFNHKNSSSEIIFLNLYIIYSYSFFTTIFYQIYWNILMIGVFLEFFVSTLFLLVVFIRVMIIRAL